MATPPHSTALLEGVEEGVDEVQGTPKAWNVRESSLAVANTRKSYWHKANSWILSTTLTNKVLKSLGWTRLADVYH